MKTRYLFLYIVLLFSSFGCENFLEEIPRDIVAPENFFNSEADARQAISGIYAILKNNSLYGQVGLDHFYDNGADIIEPNRAADFVEPIGNYSMNESLAGVSIQLMSVSDTWKDLYKIVLNSNIIIARVTNNSAIPKAAQTQIVAEATFMRAFAYWHITNLWGDAPYYEGELKIDEIKVLGRTPEATILAGIIKDLQFAQDNLPATLTVAQRGKVTKWVAATVLAKIYMKQKNWKAGLDKSLEIINQSGHKLLPNYASVFDPSNEYNSEIIWSLDFAKDIVSQFEVGVTALAGNGNWRPSMFNPRLRDEPAKTSERNALAAALTARGEAFNGTGLQITSKDFAEKFPKNDLRRPLNVMQNYLGFDLVFPYMAKFMNLKLDTSPRFNHSDNRMVFRLADIYLMAAECQNELSGPAAAYEYIHAVRKRAYATQAEWELKGLTQQQFREKMYDERKWELAGEAHRRYDLIRWGILLDVVKKLEYRFWKPNLNIKPYHVKLPIPLQELEANPNLLKSDPTNNGYRN
ncbi:RagB/SusD family nutrient uptake outer membrane protein [Lacihabitans lacunae]|uniref:RagB/SusD family nutrient uptake outer membrane protein n=1 Tax=Lacihabitans lacunae TaxID=1028214 RepID=A0ABV7YPA8_9BACT